MTIEVFPLYDIPLYNGDLDNDAHRPAVVAHFKQAISAADALLIATPEYNYSIPGVLKNAIDWASRPGLQSPLAQKPVGIIGVTPGAYGTVRAQQHLKVVLLSTLACVMPHRGIAVAKAREKFDEDGRLIDENTQRYLSQYLHELAAWVERFSNKGTANTAAKPPNANI
jgi:chromate reductase